LVPIRGLCHDERGLLLDHPAIRLGQRQAKLHAITAPGIIDGAAPQPRAIQLHIKPPSAVDDEKFCSCGTANQIRLGVPADLELSLPVKHLKLDGSFTTATFNLHHATQDHEANGHHSGTSGPRPPVCGEVPPDRLGGPRVLTRTQLVSDSILALLEPGSPLLLFLGRFRRHTRLKQGGAHQLGQP
jgi:hypothetical protein